MNKLQLAIEKSNLTNKEIAKHFNISYPSVQRLRDGNSKPSEPALSIMLKWLEDNSKEKV